MIKFIGYVLVVGGIIMLFEAIGTIWQGMVVIVIGILMIGIRKKHDGGWFDFEWGGIDLGGDGGGE